MPDITLEVVQRLVDQLTPFDQARLLAYLAPRVVQVVTSIQQEGAVSPPSTTNGWEEFFRIGDTLAASDAPELKTLTSAVLAMRR